MATLHSNEDWVRTKTGKCLTMQLKPAENYSDFYTNTFKPGNKDYIPFRNVLVSTEPVGWHCIKNNS